MVTDTLLVQQLTERVEFLEALVQAFGLPVGKWVTPNEAVAFFGKSRRLIMEEIEAAEAKRLAGQKSLLVYGIHYRNDMAADSTQNAWKINISKYGEFLKIPPEERY
ncbi:hypothetical protein [Nodosilinea nodulosa]|uniref:hypothetical protein n=1 Tax=Nodosilinea nodulosa TaxID=416001 RepID=UPI000300822E|nr:hypothetical protein [Nodosilinea nodulosa]